MFRMAREIPRTLFTLSPTNQRNIEACDYEVVVVDNGSPEPLSEAELAKFPANASYHYVETSSMSPAAAINAAIARSSTPYVGCLIDGARMASPGVVSRALDALQQNPRRFVYCPSFHLGRQLQNDSAFNGYDQQVEDKLLESVDWRNDGYLLFEICNVAATPERLMLPTFESNCFFVARSLWDEIGGYDERFTSAGGGLVNWEYFKRAVELRDVEAVNLLGEATFHQFHGGASTNHLRKDHPVRGWFREYESIIGEPFRYPKYQPRVDGVLSDFLSSIVYGANSATVVAVANDLSSAGLSNEAVSLLSTRAHNEPNNPVALRDLTQSLLAAGRSRGALDTIDTAIEIAPTQAELHATRAEILRLDGRFEEARVSIAEAMRLDPLQHEAQFQLALIERVEGNLDAAIEAFERAIEFHGGLQGAYVMQLVSALTDADQHERAKTLAYARFTHEPRDVRARLDYIDTLLSAGRRTHAQGEAEALLGDLPSRILDRTTYQRAERVFANFDEGVTRFHAHAIAASSAAPESADSALVLSNRSDETEPFALTMPDLCDRFMRSVNHHYVRVGDEPSRRVHALDGSISLPDAFELSSFVAEVAPRHCIVVGGYLGLSAAVIANSAPTGTRIDVIDPSVRHRIFDDPLSHAERFLVAWARQRSITFTRMYFATKSSDSTIYDLTHYAPTSSADEAKHRAEAPFLARVPTGQADLVYVDVCCNDADFVRIAQDSLGLAQPGTPVVFANADSARIADLHALVADREGATIERLHHHAPTTPSSINGDRTGEGLIVVRRS